VTIDGKRRKITKREAIVTEMINKSTSADLRATKMLIDMLKGAEQKAGVASPPPAPPPLSEADEEAGSDHQVVVECGCRNVRTHRLLIRPRAPDRQPCRHRGRPTHGDVPDAPVVSEGMNRT
jgi:hypothetical protein